MFKESILESEKPKDIHAIVGETSFPRDNVLRHSAEIKRSLDTMFSTSNKGWNFLAFNFSVCQRGM